MSFATREAHMTTSKSTATASVPMIICPTTHNDWDWQQTFEGYYTTAFTGHGVRGILDAVSSLLPGQVLNFSYAEVAYLRRYLAEHPEKVFAFKRAKSRFCLLGGGIVSPDNQVCHGEVFIRNYLVGHQFLKSVGLYDQVFFVAWIPDDFGHDPQLPVLLEAMGMKAAGLSRIPGSPQPQLCPGNQPGQQPADGTVRATGVTFRWPGRDGSSILTQFMPQTYYGITNYGMTDSKASMADFLDDHGGDVWPGNIIFATQGGDWQFPFDPATEQPGDAGSYYDWQSIPGAQVSGGGVDAVGSLGTFADYYNQLLATEAPIPSLTLYAENYYTGYFASRPELKTDHYAATRRLLGAEVLGALLALHGGTTAAAQEELAAAVVEAWELLVPTSHHDFVTGTSPDDIYYSTGATGNWDSAGQLPMVKQASRLAEAAFALGLKQLSETVTAPSTPSELPVLVFNQLGFDLPDTAVVEIADPDKLHDYEVRVDGVIGPVQRTAYGTILFQVPGMRAMAYKIVHLVQSGHAQPPPVLEPSPPKVVFGNDSIQVVVAQANGWAISALTIGGKSYLPPGNLVNSLQIWNDSGNIYQFGMEFTNYCNQGQFAFGSSLVGGEGMQVEAGPIRWRFLANLSDTSGNPYTTEYELIRGETLIRITTTGAAPSGTSVLTSFSVPGPQGALPDMLEYGTSYHWENRDPQQSWSGLTFRASHDFAQLVATLPMQADVATAAVYHDGIPAWTIDGGTLRGCLLRNTPGGVRAESGTDTGVHEQRYTFDVLPSRASTGYPLRTALYVSNPLSGVALGAPTGTMPEAAQLASVAQPDALIRVGKIGPPVGEGRSLILRVQKARDGSQPLDVNLPFLAQRGLSSAAIVTALETTPDRTPPPLSVVGTTASFVADRAVWTLQIVSTPP